MIRTYTQSMIQEGIAKFQIGSRAQALRTIYFADDSITHKGEIIEVTEQNLAYFHCNHEDYSVI